MPGASAGGYLPPIVAQLQADAGEFFSEDYSKSKPLSRI